jgi:acyl carrier protein
VYKSLNPKTWPKPYVEEIMDELFEKMKKLIAEKLEVEESKITLEASFRQDLGADSLDTYELVYAIEEEMGISIPDEKANEFVTVKDAVDYIRANKQ